MTPHRTFPLLSSAAILGLLASSPTHAAVLAGWDTWASGGEAPSVTTLDVTGSSSESGDWREHLRGASTDGTFGTVAGASTSTGANSSGTYIGQSSNGGTPTGGYSFTVTAGSDPLVLESFNFDARRKRGNSATTWSVSVTGGSITVGSVSSGSLGGALGGNGPSDLSDFDVALTGLADNELAAGESATFRVDFTGGNYTNNDQHTYFDNVAIIGTVVPEPAGLTLLVLGFSSILIRRRR